MGKAGTFTVTSSGLPTAALSDRDPAARRRVFTDNGNGTATLSGTPGGRRRHLHLHLHAHNGVGPDATQTFTLTVNQAPAITSANSADLHGGHGRHVHRDHHRLPDADPDARAATLPTGVTFDTATAPAR